jgi:hypothetical protein
MILSPAIRFAAGERRQMRKLFRERCYGGLFGPGDREELSQDIVRYRRRLADPCTRARRLRLYLPRLSGGASEIAAMLVRDVQTEGDSGRVMFFKDWARSDTEFSSDENGFTGLCVYQSPSTGGPARAIISVTPESGACLRGLGALLEQEEHRRRVERDGADDREIDLATGRKKPRRWPGSNSDPWYDGRGHNHTIVDAPRSGTVLSADEVESVFVQYGRRGECKP